MINELFPFQLQAVKDLRARTSIALNTYKTAHIPQVVSLQAPTGSGKTIIMAAFIEDIYSGNETYAEQPDAIFVWLSDSPQLNEQSKQKIETKADKVRFDQCVVISDESFDKEILDDGHIYFLNTQKLGKGGNLGKHSDTRTYTIWETIENTAREKADRLYFIIDEAHRGMQGREAGKATTIMQRFLKGSEAFGLSPVPVVVGMSATADRFNALVGDTTSTLQKVIVTPAQVRASGLLKDRIVITYPDDPTKHNDLAVLQAATDEWQDKCVHWYQYTYEQHYANVNPVFVIQVKAGSSTIVSDTDLDDVIAKIEERINDHFKEGEVVHTFGSIGNLTINGLNVPHVEPSDIADNRKIRVVLFKENLSTGWDCPRAETMMSFRRAEDATYIAQLLGRMIRTPLQCHVVVDDSLNDVRLYLPYFNKNTVKNVIDELQSAEGGELPTVIEGEALEEQVYVPWTVHNTGTRKKTVQQVEGQLTLDFSGGSENPVITIPDSLSSSGNVATPTQPTVTPSEQPQNQPAQSATETTAPATDASGASATQSQPDQSGSSQPPTETPQTPAETSVQPSNSGKVLDTQPSQQILLLPEIDREAVTKFINEQGYLTYSIRSVRVNSYLKSLLSLAGLLTQYVIYQDANDDIKDEVSDIIRKYINELHANGKYEGLVKQVLEFKLSIQIFDPFGDPLKGDAMEDWLEASETDLDRQLRVADAKMGGYGFPFVYGRRFINFDDPNAFKIDCILFAADDECMRQLNLYAEKKFHELNDKYRVKIASRSEKCRKDYDSIVANGDVISKHNFTLPETISAKVESGGIVYRDHLFADANGEAKIKLNAWEQEVLKEEQKRPDFVCWLRNMVRQSWSLCIPYEMNGVHKAAYPDFIIIRKDEDLGYILDVLEPHSPDFSDNLAKAKGFAEYAAAEPLIDRIQLIRQGKDAAGITRFKRLDLSKGAIRTKVLDAVSNDELNHIFDTDGIFED